jgi:hypothetical protein
VAGSEGTVPDLNRRARGERIAAEFKQRQVSTEEALHKLVGLVEEINAARQEQAEHKISAESFTIF